MKVSTYVLAISLGVAAILTSPQARADCELDCIAALRACNQSGQSPQYCTYKYEICSRTCGITSANLASLDVDKHPTSAAHDCQARATHPLIQSIGANAPEAI